MSSLEWFEYAEGEEQLQVLSSHLQSAREDLIKYEEDLSPISIRAIKNEIQRLIHYSEDIQEMLDTGEFSTES
jgi:hypothetical protein